MCVIQRYINTTQVRKYFVAKNSCNQNHNTFFMIHFSGDSHIFVCYNIDSFCTPISTRCGIADSYCILFWYCVYFNYEIYSFCNLKFKCDVKLQKSKQLTIILYFQASNTRFHSLRSTRVWGFYLLYLVFIFEIKLLK